MKKIHKPNDLDRAYQNRLEEYSCYQPEKELSPKQPEIELLIAISG
ncbi:hypothetical protein H3S84_04625 [Bartonella sp. W8098]|nr:MULTISPECIES: hypothetical protein [Bartonella]MBH9987549.1 hypothetical protein [Bartonella apis]MBI0171442.1 hypothetical protein [Bartonella sp. W8151]